MKKLFVSVTVLAAVGVLPALAMAAEAAASGGGPSEYMMKFAIALAAGLGLGLSAFGGAAAQGKAAAAALEGIARNPGASGRIFTPMIIGLAMIESLVIYSFVLSLLLVFLKL